ncbi:hypothetical protein [Desulfitobacterium hafniense]|nr:hypothetical protein [Desulfitobacterium hafniense]
MEQIAYHNEIIEKKKKIKATQLAEIQLEMQKIADIMDFIGTNSIKREGF